MRYTWRMHCQSCPSNFKEDGIGMPPIRSREGRLCLGTSIVLRTQDIPRSDGSHITIYEAFAAFQTLQPFKD